MLGECGLSNVTNNKNFLFCGLRELSREREGGRERERERGRERRENTRDSVRAREQGLCLYLTSCSGHENDPAGTYK